MYMLYCTHICHNLIYAIHRSSTATTPSAWTAARATLSAVTPTTSHLRSLVTKGMISQLIYGHMVCLYMSCSRARHCSER